TTKHRLLPIQLERQVVGYLTLRIFTPRRTELDQQFEQQQFDNLLLTALLSLLIAIIAALLLARLFVRPISGIAKMARQLTAGQFEVRIEKIRRDELGDLAADLNTLVETLEQNQRSRRQWIADISHELRTPLTVLRGELEAMEDGVRPLNRESIQSLSLEVKQLKRLVDDLYQLSLSDQGSLSYEKERVLPLELLRGVAEGFIVTMQQRQIILTVGCEGEGPHLLADPQRLTQLFTNLLENSQRYTDEGGEVKVHCEVGSSLLIHFEDSAPGVPPELIPRIFERLFRVEGSRNRDHGGSGLGLSIVQSIAKAHGGELRAEPSSLGGLTITLQLPIDPKR
ncbi:MAG: HAMP domain-containing protein, partial [Gammaproteobacteria bacterium]|nr:HAMP domain-containing protein [Gammaproteobacteria bacterium]